MHIVKNAIMGWSARGRPQQRGGAQCTVDKVPGDLPPGLSNPVLWPVRGLFLPALPPI